MVNRLIALQSFDEDGDPCNGIRITDALKNALKAGALDFAAPAASFDTCAQHAARTLPAPYATRVSDASRRALAREHFENTLAAQLGAPVTETATQSNALGASR